MWNWAAPLDLSSALSAGSSALVFGWFTNPAMLWGLGAASIPIIIHLLNRRKFREVRWAAMRFLLAAMRKNQRRIKIEQWLLLAIRTLVILLVVTAMAKPFLESLGAIPLLPGQRTHWVIVLDGSMSMDYATAETTRFEQAKTVATQLVKATRQGDAMSVVLMADPPRSIIGAPAFNRDAVLKEIAEISLPHGGTNLRATFDKVNEVLDASPIPRKEVVFLTDLQTASWNPTKSKPDEGLTRALALLAAKRPRSLVIDVGATGAENRAITDLAVTPTIVTPGIPVVARAVVRNFSGKPADNVRVRLLVDGQLGPEPPPVTLEPGEDQPVAFTYEFAAPGEHILEVQLDDDPLKLDNHRWRAVPVREAVRVLLIDGDPKTEGFRSETDFLAVALSPEADSSGSPSPIQVEVASESQLAGRDLAPYDTVVLCNVSRVSPAEVSALDGYLKQGGGVVIFGGDQVVAENYNQYLFVGGKGLLPAEVGATFGDPQKQEDPFLFDPLQFKHPIIAAFGGEAPDVVASLTNVKTARFHRLRVPKNSTAAVALAFRNGDPAIVEMPRYRGRVIQVATSADTAWTNWPMHQSYPPVMEQIIMQAAAGRAAERNVQVGQVIEQAFPPTGADASVTVQRPTGPPALTKLVADGDVSALKFDKTDLSGSYRVQVGAPVSSDGVFAVNIDPHESDPAKLDHAGLKEALPNWEFFYDNDWRPLSSNASSVGQRGELHRPLLWAVLTLLIIESIVAWRFGHHA
jgi:hypothetical protein